MKRFRLTYCCALLFVPGVAAIMRGYLNREWPPLPSPTVYATEGDLQDEERAAIGKRDITVLYVLPIQIVLSGAWLIAGRVAQEV